MAAYNFLLESHPKLAEVQLRVHEGNRAAYYHHGIVGTSDPPFVSLNKDWRSVSQAALKEQDKEYIRELISSNLGVAEITEEFLFTFVLMHEFGHAYFFYGMTKEEVRSYKDEHSKEFRDVYGARHYSEFRDKHPDATNKTLSNVFKAYKEQSTEQRADSLACEFIQKIESKNKGTFPEVTNLIKNYH